MYWLFVHLSFSISNFEDDLDKPAGVKFFISSSLVNISSSDFGDQPSNERKFKRASGK
jgi:hypothetical protein